MDFMEKYQYWKEQDYFDADTKKELDHLSEEEIMDRFGKDLEFGTGGLRGVIGAGSNRMNIYTVRKATQGLANYIKKKGCTEKGVAIAYDSRNFSKIFAAETALCLNANDIPAYVFESLRPTPELSFAVRKLSCAAGIVITASHNPPEYNGYKVYWEDGAQITAPLDKEIIQEVNEVEDYAAVKVMKEEAAVEKGLLHTIGEEIDSAYMEELKKLVLHPEVIKEQAENLKIVYSPLHGTGNIPVRRVLKELGFQHVYVVPEQEAPDGNFPTVDYPNPEDKKTFTLALKLAKDVGADLVLATDPDADRLGVYAKDSKSGEYMQFTGNMSGVLIGEYLTSEQKALGILPQDGAWVRTIVTTKMADAIAEDYGLSYIEVLTGFKYIGEQIKWMEEKQNYHYVFGFEESYGCLAGTYARDKDAVGAVMALCEAAAFYKQQGMTLWDKMISLYEKYGYYKEDLVTAAMKGADGNAKRQAIMERLRKEPLIEVAGYPVKQIRDYKSGISFNLETKQRFSVKLPTSDVLYYELPDNMWFCVRPSGTEPKIKLYAGVKGSSEQEATDNLQKLINELSSIVQGE